MLNEVRMKRAIGVAVALISLAVTFVGRTAAEERPPLVVVLLDDSGSMSVGMNDPHGSAPFAVVQLERFLPKGTRYVVYTYASAGAGFALYDSKGILDGWGCQKGAGGCDLEGRMYQNGSLVSRSAAGRTPHPAAYPTTPCFSSLKKVVEAVSEIKNLDPPGETAVIYLTDGECTPKAEMPDVRRLVELWPSDVRFFFVGYGYSPPHWARALANGDGKRLGGAVLEIRSNPARAQSSLDVFEIFGKILDYLEHNHATRVIPPTPALDYSQALEVNLLYTSPCEGDGCSNCGRLETIARDSGLLLSSRSAPWKWAKAKKGKQGELWSAIQEGEPVSRFCWSWIHLRGGAPELVRPIFDYLYEGIKTGGKAIVRATSIFKSRLDLYEGKCSSKGKRVASGRPESGTVCAEVSIKSYASGQAENATLASLQMAYADDPREGGFPNTLSGVLTENGVVATNEPDISSGTPVWRREVQVPPCALPSQVDRSVTVGFKLVLDGRFELANIVERVCQCKDEDDDGICAPDDCNDSKERGGEKVRERKSEKLGKECTLPVIGESKGTGEEFCPDCYAVWDPPACGKGQWECDGTDYRCRRVAGSSYPDHDGDGVADCFDDDDDNDGCPDWEEFTSGMNVRSPMDKSIHPWKPIGPTIVDGRETECGASTHWAISRAEEHAKKCKFDEESGRHVIEFGEVDSRGALASCWLSPVRLRPKGAKLHKPSIVPVLKIDEVREGSDNECFSVMLVAPAGRIFEAKEPQEVQFRVTPKAVCKGVGKSEASPPHLLDLDATLIASAGEPEGLEKELEPLSLRFHASYSTWLDLKLEKPLILVPSGSEDSITVASFSIHAKLPVVARLKLAEHISIRRQGGDKKELWERLLDFTSADYEIKGGRAVPDDPDDILPRLVWTNCREGEKGLPTSEFLELVQEGDGYKLCLGVAGLDPCRGSFISPVSSLLFKHGTESYWRRALCLETDEQETYDLVLQDVVIGDVEHALSTGAPVLERKIPIQLRVERSFWQWFFAPLGGWLWIPILFLGFITRCLIYRRVHTFRREHRIVFRRVDRCDFEEVNGKWVPRLRLIPREEQCEITLRTQEGTPDRTFCSNASNKTDHFWNTYHAYWVRLGMESEAPYVMGVTPGGGQIVSKLLFRDYSSQESARQTVKNLPVPRARVQPGEVPGEPTDHHLMKSLADQWKEPPLPDRPMTSSHGIPRRGTIYMWVPVLKANRTLSGYDLYEIWFKH